MGGVLLGSHEQWAARVVRGACDLMSAQSVLGRRVSGRSHAFAVPGVVECPLGPAERSLWAFSETGSGLRNRLPVT